MQQFNLQCFWKFCTLNQLISSIFNYGLLTVYKIILRGSQAWVWMQPLAHSSTLALQTRTWGTNMDFGTVLWPLGLLQNSLHLPIHLWLLLVHTALFALSSFLFPLYPFVFVSLFLLFSMFVPAELSPHHKLYLFPLCWWFLCTLANSSCGSEN